ncbi:hypothetical protein FJZ36_16875 [Candidatus Poribacteria bacterium]|nr:hypothetical protein [Candidatus Poribacteria bacterium]
MRRIPPKMLLFLVALGAIVYWTRAKSEWLAALLTLGVIAAIVIVRMALTALSRRKGSESNGTR